MNFRERRLDVVVVSLLFQLVSFLTRFPSCLFFVHVIFHVWNVGRKEMLGSLTLVGRDILGGGLDTEGWEGTVSSLSILIAVLNRFIPNMKTSWCLALEFGRFVWSVSPETGGA